MAQLIFFKVDPEMGRERSRGQKKAKKEKEKMKMKMINKERTIRSWWRQRKAARRWNHSWVA
jgi:hypothetical protein